MIYTPRCVNHTEKTQSDVTNLYHGHVLMSIYYIYAITIHLPIKML